MTDETMATTNLARSRIRRRITIRKRMKSTINHRAAAVGPEAA